MKDLLREAFDRVSELPTDKQERFARFVLAELESDELLDRLADEALSEHRVGGTRLLDPDDL